MTEEQRRQAGCPAWECFAYFSDRTLEHQDTLGVRSSDRADTGPDVAGSAARRRLVRRVAGAVVVLLAAVSTACGRSDEDRIRRRLEELAQTVSVEDRETSMIRQARATRLTTFLTLDADVDVGAPFSPVSGRDAVARVAAAVRVPAGGVRVEFNEVRVTLDNQTRRALATATASVMAGTAVGGELLQVRELDMVFNEIDGEWLIEQVQLVAIR